MSKKYTSRETQRENRRKKRVAQAKERQLSGQNEFGINDPTPREAVSNIMNEQYRHDTGSM